MGMVDPRDLSGRNPREVARRIRAFSWLSQRYFRAEFEGLENVPRDEGAILFGHHSGSTYTFEAALLTAEICRRFGSEHPLYILCHKAFFDIPWLSKRMIEFGCILADREVAAEILRNKGQFIVFPGGERDSHKSFRLRHKVDFHGRKGFIRLSLRERAPLIPFAHVGTHETMMVLSSGEGIAKRLGMKKRLGLDVWPLVLSFPFGLSLGPYFPAIPLPAKVRMKVLEPVRLWEMGWDDPDNPEHLEASLSYLTELVQAALTELAEARRLPFFG